MSENLLFRLNIGHEVSDINTITAFFNFNR